MLLTGADAVPAAGTLAQQLAIAAAVGASSGAIGAFVVLKRMALVGDALSHVALPGIALALAYGLDPLWGIVVSLLLAAGLVWWLQDQTGLPVDALVGLLFTASLAVGILLIPDAEILESLFGAFPALSAPELAITLGSALAALGVTFAFARRFLLRVLSEDLARVAGAGRGYDLLLLVVFCGVVALGIKLVGTLLMGALTIIPASIARNVAGGMRAYMMGSAACGAAVAVAGTALAAWWSLRPGPTIILLGVVVFVFSLPFAARAGK
ncbi:MAG: metal ABC transporter permease [Candidatus Sericytochromatia bacterium]|nr:metal ABC transporter permease [Candidatus Tanganyikabacteria bacterium]